MSSVSILCIVQLVFSTLALIVAVIAAIKAN